MAVSVLRRVCLKLSSLEIMAYGIERGMDGQLASLQTVLSGMLAAAGSHTGWPRPSIRGEHQLAVVELVFDADDLVDMIQREAIRRRAAGSMSQACNLNFLLCIGAERDDIRGRLSDLRRRLAAVGRHPPREAPSEGQHEAEEVDFIEDAEIYGRDEDKENIIGIMRAQADRDLLVISIAGACGVGKSTLGQLVYNDPWVKEHFDPRIWLRSSPGMESVLLRLGGQRLSGRRFLLVLDNARVDCREDWSKLEESLRRGGRSGSTVIVTTRSCRLARLVGTADPYCLLLLPEEECWRVFRKHAFGVSLDGVDEGLVAIGRQIAKKCGGLPLAARAMGELLHGHPNLDAEARKIWQDGHIAEQMLRRLHANTASCFEYLSLFPSDYIFDKLDLIDLWIAEGFTQLLREGTGRSEMEDTANSLLTALESDSFLQDMQESNHQVSFQMQEVARKLAQFVGGDLFMTMRCDGARAIPQTCRYLSLVCGKERSTFPRELFKGNNLRTLLLFGEGQSQSHMKIGITEVPQGMFSSLTKLRVLDLHSSCLSRLPDSVGELVYLKFLNLSHTDIIEVPESIGNLQLLQILKLSDCRKLQTLPESTRKLQLLEKLDLKGCHHLRALPEAMNQMTMLRHLNILECFSLTRMPYGMGRLSKLRMLTRFLATGEPEHCIKELGSLEKLEGELWIENLDKVTDTAEAEGAKLVEKHKIQSLVLQWDCSNVDADTVKQVLEALQPHPNLEKLKIVSYPGSEFPYWMAGTTPSLLSQLVEIRLVDVKKCRSLPALGGIPLLKNVEVSGMDAVRRVDESFYGDEGTFPKLESLTLSKMLNLEEWWLVEGDLFPCLSDLTINWCPKLKALPPCLPSVAKLALWSDNRMLYNTAGALYGVSKSLKKLSIWLCQELLESSACEGLEDLAALEELEIAGCDELTSLPEGMQHLTTVKSLTILNCINMVTLPKWLVNFTSLVSQNISGCPKLTPA